MRGSGLVEVGVISIDGTKIRANASRGANRTYEKLVADILKEAEETDRENHRAEIEANTAYEAWRARRAAGGVSGQKLGMPPKPFTPSPVPQGVMNKTDHDSRMMRTEGQPTVQGYNAQAAVTRGQIIVAAEITVASPDFGHLEPVVNATLRELAAAGVTERPETVLADAGYWHKEQMQSIVSDGIQVLVPPDGGLRKDIRPGWDKGMYSFMRRMLASEAGHALYKHRKATVEPVSAQIKFNRKINRFQRRGRAAALSEWRLVAATHNLMKLHNHWITPLTARPESERIDARPPTAAHGQRRRRPADPPSLYPTATAKSATRGALACGPAFQPRVVLTTPDSLRCHPGLPARCRRRR